MVVRVIDYNYIIIFRSPNTIQIRSAIKELLSNKHFHLSIYNIKYDSDTTRRYCLEKIMHDLGKKVFILKCYLNKYE